MSSAASANGAAVAATADPAAAFDNLLSKELLQLSANDRNDREEEIHGVRCLAPDETSRLVEDSLHKLAIELDEVIPVSKKLAYLQSQQRPASAAFINSRDFRLRFLRCELFNCRKAAERMVRVCDCLLNLFGRYALERQIKLSDFTNAELKAIRKGRLQLLPFRDRTGRRIVILFPGAQGLKEKISNNQTQVRVLQIKTFLYLSYIVGSDVDAQRRGVVFLVWFDAMLETSTSLDVSGIVSGGVKSHQISMIRGSAFHICSPDTLFYRLQRSILCLNIGRYRTKMRIHLGESMELRYILDGYGISTDTIPISWTGTVKVGYLKQWLRIRHCLEDPSFYKHRCNDSAFCSKTCNNMNTSKPCICKFSPPIECPYLNDILYKKGKSAKKHPGNDHFRSSIQTKYERERFSSSEIVDANHQNRTIASLESNPNNITRSLVTHFSEEVRKGNLRVLMWNEKHSWWSILNDERLIRKKFEKTVISSSKSAYRSPPLLLQEEEATPQQQHPPAEIHNSCDGCMDLEQGHQRCLQGVAFMFGSQGQDGGSKRRRLVVNSISDGNAWDFGGSSYDEIMPSAR